MGLTENEWPGWQKCWSTVELELCLLLICWEILCRKQVLVWPIYCFLHLLHCIKYMMCFELQLNVPRILKDLLVMVQCIFRDLLMYLCKKQLLIGQKKTESSVVWNGSIVGLSSSGWCSIWYQVNFVYGCHGDWFLILLSQGSSLSFCSFWMP